MRAWRRAGRPVGRAGQRPGCRRPPRDRAATTVAGNSGSDGGRTPGRRGAGAGRSDFLRPGSGANRALAGGPAATARKLRRLRAEAYRHAAGVRRRQPAGARHVRRRGARTRRGYRGAAVRRPFRQIAGPDDRHHRARPQQGLYRQRDSVAAARQPDADAAGNSRSACRSSGGRSSWSIPTCW